MGSLLYTAIVLAAWLPTGLHTHIITPNLVRSNVP